MNISPADRSAFANALTNVCSNSQFSCAFVPTGSPTWAQGKPYIPQQEHSIIGCATGNSGVAGWESTNSEESSVSDTIGEAASVGFEDIANVSVNHSVEHTQTWGTSTSNSGSMNVTAPKDEVAFVSESAGIESVVGNFTATVGGTTFQLNGVTIEQPGQASPNGDVQPYADAVAYRPMTQADWNTCSGPQL